MKLLEKLAKCVTVPCQAQLCTNDSSRASGKTRYVTICLDLDCRVFTACSVNTVGVLHHDASKAGELWKCWMSSDL